MAKDMLEEYFIEGVKTHDHPEDILNWYRNLYYKENAGTERRIMAEAINYYFVDVHPFELRRVKKASAETIGDYIFHELHKNEKEYLYKEIIRPALERYKEDIKDGVI